MLPLDEFAFFRNQRPVELPRPRRCTRCGAVGVTVFLPLRTGGGLGARLCHRCLAVVDARRPVERVASIWAEGP